MKGPGMKKYWKVGELAAETGLTVRTLHHYDELGLLKPSHQSDGGHRIYNRADLLRLQKIMTLKQLGLALDAIKNAIDDAGFSLKTASADLRADLQRRRADLEELEARLATVDEAQGKDEAAPADGVLTMISRLSLYDRHLSKEQQDRIREHDLKFGPSKLQNLHEEWRKTTDEVYQAMLAKTSVSSWRTAALCTRWLGLASAFTGGSLTIAHELKRIIRTDSGAALPLGMPGQDLERVIDYVELVLADANKRNAKRDPNLVAFVHIGTNDLERATAFYDRLLTTLECRKMYHHPDEVVYGKRGPELWLTRVTDDGRAMTPGNASEFGMWAESPAQVDAFHVAARAEGAVIVDAPAFRDSGHIYSCTIKDLDGNKVVAMRWFDEPQSS